MKISEMNLEQIKLRKSQISKRTNQEGLKLEDIAKLEKELDSLDKQEKELRAIGKQKIELRNKAAKQTEGTTILEKIDKEERSTMKETKVYEIDSVEYRNAFLKTLRGQDLTVEERAAYQHNTTNSNALIPKEMEDRIYSNMAEKHPLLNDVRVIRSGTVFSVTKHTAIAAGDAKVVAEGAANDDEKNTFVNVPLVGKKVSKHVDYTYELEAMAMDAFQTYIEDEITDRISAAVTGLIVTQVETDLATANKFAAATPGKLVLADVLKAFGLLKGVGRVNVYVSGATLFNNLATLEGDAGRVSFIPNFAEGISGQLLGKSIKEEDAVADGKVLLLDPQQYLMNIIKPIELLRDRDVKTGDNTVAGHTLVGGSMTNDKAGAIITVGTAL